MDVESAKVLPKLLLFLRPNVLEILAAEDDYSSLCNQQRQLVLLGIAELAQLEPFDLSPDPGSELGDEDVWIVGCKVRLCFVCESAFVNDLERLGEWEEGGIVINREVVSVFVLVSKLART